MQIMRNHIYCDHFTKKFNNANQGKLPRNRRQAPTKL